jgi:putative hemolysin
MQLLSATQVVGNYRLDFATTEADVARAQALRYSVFNQEMGSGLVQSAATQRDVDAFDAVCDHLLVWDQGTDQVVGTYRMQTGVVAQTHLGYYCAQEFDLQAFDACRAQTLELGRACIDKAHRNFQVLSMLWRGIASYAHTRGARYLIGCSSLTSQDPAVGHAAAAMLDAYLAPQRFRTRPHPVCALPAQTHPVPAVKLPKLLAAYLSLGAWICGPPAMDREFKSIDFLTLMDLQSEGMRLRRQRFGISS